MEALKITIGYYTVCMNHIKFVTAQEALFLLKLSLEQMLLAST